MTITPWPYRRNTFLSPLLKAVRSVLYGIRNLIYWFPLIWQDRNHHYQFIFRILRHKLFDMERMPRSEGLAADSERSARQLHLCVALLDRLIFDDYTQDAHAYNSKKRMEHLSMLKKQDIDYLFGMIAKHCDKWWD